MTTSKKGFHILLDGLKKPRLKSYIYHGDTICVLEVHLLHTRPALLRPIWNRTLLQRHLTREGFDGAKAEQGRAMKRYRKWLKDRR